MEFRYTYGDSEVVIRLEPQAGGGYVATIGDRTYTVEVDYDAGKQLVFSMDGQRARAVIASADKDTLYVAHAGHTYRLERATQTAARRRGSGGAGGGLTADLPGQVMEVLVTEGDVVDKGQPLLLLEAMKMEIRVAAPHAGTVTRLLVSAGDTVERGQQLAEVTPDA